MVSTEVKNELLQKAAKISTEVIPITNSFIQNFPGDVDLIGNMYLDQILEVFQDMKSYYED